MKATIWHNPECSTSRKALARLEEAGADITVIPYKKQPFDRATLERLFAAAGLTPQQALRMRGTPAEALGLSPNSDSDSILDAMVSEPILVERPFVETDKGVRLGRPIEKMEEIL